MNLDRNYQNCFWTASGDLDCQSMTTKSADHSYHVPLSGTRYLTQLAPQINQNLGYNPRSCAPQTQVQPFQEPLTQFNLPRSVQPNVYQTQWARQATPLSGFSYPDPTPNCASCYSQQPISGYLPFGNQPAPAFDSEASYNWGHGLSGGGLSGSSLGGGLNGSLTMGARAIPAGHAGQIGTGYGQAGMGSGAGNGQIGNGPRQVGAGPFSSQPKDMNAFSLIQYKAPTLTKELGRPDVVDPNLGGIAIWKERSLQDKFGGIFKRVELHDEKIANLDPPYIGNVYSWIKMNIKSSVFRDILDIFPNVWYDRQKRWLSVRTDTLDNNLATVALICLINRGVLDPRQIRNYDLHRKYMLAVDNRSQHYNRYARGSYVNIIKKCALR